MNAVKQDLKKEVTTKEAPQNVKLLPTGKTVEPTQEQKKASTLEAIEKLTPKAPLSAEERIKKIEQFKALSERFNVLKGKDNDLKLFIAGNDKMTAKISLENQAGFKMDIRNSNVIEKVLKTMQDELNLLLIEAEKEVLNFEI